MNLNDPSTRKRMLLGFPQTGFTKWRDLQDDLNAIAGILIARPKPHFEEKYKAYDFIIHPDGAFTEATKEQITTLCATYKATFLITT